MEPVVEEGKTEKPPAMKTCECRLVGNGIDMHLAHVTLRKGAEAGQFAKRARKQTNGTLRRLELPGYQIVVIDGATRSHFALKELG